MAAPITAILNSFAPATGQNAAQLVIRGDGSIQFFGDEAISRLAIRSLLDALINRPAELTPAAPWKKLPCAIPTRYR
jgi:hypothetical protein